MAELFETRVRYSGVSFGYQMAGVIGSAPAPLVATALVHWAHGSSSPVATYMAASALISFIAAYFISKRNRVAIIADAIPAAATT